MKINENIVLELSRKYNCPILEIWGPDKDDGSYYVCFEQYTCVLGKGRIVGLDEVMEEAEKYENVEYMTNEVYCDDELEETYFEQVTFQWKE